MLSYRAIEPRTLELLKGLSGKKFLSEARLVGGTALALQYGHRLSIDLDFFGRINGDFDWIEELSGLGKLAVVKESPNIHVYIVDGVKVDFVNYPYPWIDDAVREDGISLASPKDIAAMKVNAIEGRGSKKDFIDFYFLLQHYSLQEILDFYVQKYPEHSLLRAVMSLTYFEDAEMQYMPRMFADLAWEDVKSLLQQNVARISL